MSDITLDTQRISHADAPVAPAPGYWKSVTQRLLRDKTTMAVTIVLLAILFIFSIHFVNTHLRPDSFPMDMVIFTGRESEEEFKNRRPDEYKRMMSEGKSATRITDAPQPWLINFSRVVGFTAILIGLTLLILTLTAYIAG